VEGVEVRVLRLDKGVERYGGDDGIWREWGR
jgi:hypothetical protein